MARSQGRKLAELTEVVEVLLPCNALFDPLQDLDGDGAIDCKVTQEQNAIAELVPEIEGTWRVLSTLSSGTMNAEHLPKDSLTIGGGALCVATEQLPWTLSNVPKEQLPLALANVVRFTNDGKPCSADKPCQATMWSFDLAYPSSSCTPEVVGWIQPSVAKLLPDGTLVLLRGAAVQGGADARRPPLMETIESAAGALQFASGLSASGLNIEVLLLSTYHNSASGSNNVLYFYTEARHLQSSSSSSDEDNDNETSTDNETTTGITTSTETTTTITVNTSTTVNLTDLNSSNVSAEAEIGDAPGLRVWSTAFFCFALRLLIN
eukprot:gnl/MRDRNA2_/MRDRNA2_96043_c0_seq1.p1 gnl/MRDRNA2_/MRDRNA2_96043_c0~~gnl/MRDRNA2_/MRDRNA2_96043_c0_seq1.p1  ORF type:complete len:375 (+),score=91.37 gnl/MRDRNA2_/MRDRNA2_96043_c0_seq1:164-1126(+)